MDRITIPYTPRPIWKSVIHSELERHRFSVVVAHRRFGKTVGMINHLIKKGILNRLPSPNYAYLAPYRKQAKLIAWAYLKYYTSVIPDIKVNESELFVELPSAHKGRQGCRIYIHGADKPDALRGIYLDGVVLDEYAQMKQTVWDEIVRPALSDREGWAVFIGTPKGQNSFYSMYQKAVANKDWYTCRYTVAETNVIPEEELALMKEDMTENSIRQELYCDFTASATNVLIPIDAVTEACKRTMREELVAGSPLVMGVDVARFGDDSTSITMRKGIACYEPLVVKGQDNMQVASLVASLIEQHNPRMVFIDITGVGSGVYDRLKQLGYRNISAVAFGGQANKPNIYANKRAEMWYECAEWIKNGAILPNDERLKSELVVPTYDYDSTGKIVLESKALIKKRLGFSPDIADSLVLTFASHVPAEAVAINRQAVCNTAYKPF